MDAHVVSRPLNGSTAKCITSRFPVGSHAVGQCQWRQIPFSNMVQRSYANNGSLVVPNSCPGSQWVSQLVTHVGSKLVPIHCEFLNGSSARRSLSFSVLCSSSYLPFVAIFDVVGVVVVRCAVCRHHLCRRRVPIGSQNLRGFLYGASARASPRLSPGFATVC